MEKTILSMVEGGLKWEFIFTLMQLMLVAYVILLLRSMLINELAWRKFKSSLVIGINTRIRLNTPSGYVDGQIIQASRNSIKVDIGDAIVYIPMKSFPNKEWIVVKPAPLEKKD